MGHDVFCVPLCLPAQGSAETEATILEWRVRQGDQFAKGTVLAQAESAKSVFDFLAPCNGRVLNLFRAQGDTVSFEDPVLEIETADAAMKQWLAVETASSAVTVAPAPSAQAPATTEMRARQAVILGLGGYLPQRVVTNAEIVAGFPEITDQYIEQVTGIRERRWAADEKPSDMAYAAALESIENAGLEIQDIDGIVLSTTTPDVAMPSTACIVAQRLGLRGIPAFDLNAACSGWLYSVSMAHGMIQTGIARHVLTLAVDIQSRLLDKNDRVTYFLFGDGAGAAVIGQADTGHAIHAVTLGVDPTGLRLARREEPGYYLSNGCTDIDPWIRVDGQALFRAATENFASIIGEAITKAGWTPEEIRWFIPHQANGRILKAAAKRMGIAFDRFYLNVERLGNTSSASIPLAMLEVEQSLKPGDKLILSSVGAGLTTAAIAIEW